MPVTMSFDVNYPYHPCRHFWYLCQLASHPATIVYENLNGQWHSHLFLPNKDPKRLLWEGDYLYKGHAEAYEYADHIHDLSELDHWLTEHAAAHIYFNPQDKDIAAHFKHHKNTHDLTGLLLEKRLLKQDYELNAMQKACKITAACHNALMGVMQPGMNESELEGHFILEGHKHGVKQQAYSPIIAGGNRACTLHYTLNNQKIDDGDLVLVDAGWVADGYCADITRTYPINGMFTPAQLDIYNLVLKAQQETIALLKPGIDWGILKEQSYKILAEGLYQLKFFKTLDESVEKTKQYFPHGIGHWLGLDVHDPCPYKDANDHMVKFASGMTLTIEPGLYFPINSQVPTAFKGIGIRIEDDCMITAKGHEVMTKSAIKDPQVIMDMMKK